MGPPHEHKVVIPRLPLRSELDIRSIRLAMRSQQLVLAQLSCSSGDESKENATIASTDTEHEVANLHALPHLHLIDFTSLLVPGQLRPLSNGRESAMPGELDLRRIRKERWKSRQVSSWWWCDA